MADVFTPEKRSWVMSRIRNKFTGIDLQMREILAETGATFEMYPRMPGNPDFASSRMRIAVFCDGDFWHGYHYRRGKIPRQKFWREKILRNMVPRPLCERDAAPRGVVSAAVLGARYKLRSRKVHAEG